MIRIRKSARQLVHGGKTYHCALGFCPTGAKTREGDGKTPEGSYIVCTKNEASKFYLSLGISYPNEQDAETAYAEGRITKEQRDSILLAVRNGKRPPWDTPLGGFIMIHGEKPGGAEGDWTHGCIALRNEEIEELFDSVTIGEPIEIEP